MNIFYLRLLVDKKFGDLEEGGMKRNETEEGIYRTLHSKFPLKQP